MGQIKNIKLHIVTDIKQTNTQLVPSTTPLTLSPPSTAMAFVSRMNMLTKAIHQTVIRRNLATSTKLMDPVQNLFLSKLNQYKELSADLPEGDLHDAIPEIEEEKKFMIDNINKRYGPGMEDAPVFSWEK